MTPQEARESKSMKLILDEQDIKQAIIIFLLEKGYENQNLDINSIKPVYVTEGEYEDQIRRQVGFQISIKGD